MSDSSLRSFAEGGGVYDKLSRDILGGDYELSGGSSIIGDDVTVENVLIEMSSYPKTASAKVKGELIRRIGTAVRKLGAKVNMKDQGTIIESVKKYLPDPDQKSTIRAEKGKLCQIVKTIAKVINNVFSQSGSTQVINLDQDPKYLIRDVATHIYGLSCGTHIEFYKIFGILKNTLNKLDALQVISDNLIQQKLSKAASRATDKQSSNEIEEAQLAVKAALGQMKGMIQQIRMATNVLSTDENKILMEMDRHKGRFDKITTHVDAWDDTDDGMVGDTIARLLSTLGNSTVIADIVDNSLKDAGLTMSQFKNARSFGEIFDTVQCKIMKMNPTKDAKKIGDILYHTDQLKKYFGRRHKISGGGYGDSSGGNFEMLSEPLSSEAPSFQGGDDGGYDSSGADAEPFGVFGGALTPEETERVAKKKRAELAVRAFVTEMNDQINEFVENIYEASKYLGDVTYDTQKVVDALENMKYIEALRDPNVYLALVGYYVDDTYRGMAAQYKEKLLKSVRSFKEIGKKLPAARKPLDAAGENIYLILKKVDFFSDLLKTLLASTSLPDIKDIVSSIPQSMGNIKLALNRFYHALHVSQMRRNIKKNAENLDRYTEQYPELLAWAVGNRRQDLDREHAILTADPRAAADMSAVSPGSLTSDTDVKACSLVYQFTDGLATRLTTGAPGAPGPPPAPLGPAPAGATTKSDIQKYLVENKQEFVKLLREVDDEFRAKHRLYKALESLDLLLSAFTKEIVGDIDLMKEIKKYLDDTKVYTKWFTDYTGNLLSAVFESMPAYVSHVGDPRTAQTPYDTALGVCAQTDLPGDMKLSMGANAQRANKYQLNFKPPNAGASTSGYDYGDPQYSKIAERLKDPTTPSFYYRLLTEAIKSSDFLPMYGKATGVVCMKGKDKTRKNIDEFYNNFQALKNIFHSFISLYNRVIERSVKSSSIMTPSQIYYSILSYLKQSALARRNLNPGCHNIGSARELMKAADVGVYETIPNRTTLLTQLMGMIMPAYYPIFTTKVNYMINDGFYKGAPPPPPPPAADPYEYREKAAYLYDSVYDCEDRYCAMGIKSVASAVLSCIGLYTVVQQPVNMGMQRAVRSIMGGGKGGRAPVTGGLGLLTSSLHGDLEPVTTPSICEGAFEAYYYVTRLAEFYKLLFKRYAKKVADCKDPMVGMNPRFGGDVADAKGTDYVIRLPIDLEGEFGKLLYIVDRSSGSYTDNDAKVIISEINKAYGKHKTTEDTVMAFVKEVNRRFSILVDAESNKKLRKFEGRIGTAKENREDEVDEDFTQQVGRFGTEHTGSMPFEHESYGDADPNTLDSILTPSDALGKSYSKYATADYEELEETGEVRATSTASFGAHNPLRDRAMGKYKLGCEYKLYQKLVILRTELDAIFDDYLKSKPGEGDVEVRMKRYPMSTDVYRESFHNDFVDDMKLRLKDARGDAGGGEIKFKIALDLINSRGKGGEADKGGVNVDTLFVFQETVALMTDGLVNARNILHATLMDLAVFSGDVFYQIHNGDGSGVNERLQGAPSIFGAVLAAAALPANGGPGGVLAPLPTTTLSKCYPHGNPAGGTPDLDYEMSAYSIIIQALLKDHGGIKLLGLGNIGQAGSMKNCIASLYNCKDNMRPWKVAESKYGSNLETGSSTEEGVIENKRAQFIIEVINQVIMRFDLTPVYATAVGTVSRLSSVLGGLISTTISTQGTYMDVTPIQNLLIDCLSDAKQMGSQFYDSMPKGFMTEYYERSGPPASIKAEPPDGRRSIYDVEYDLTTIFEPHFYQQIKHPALIASVNSTMTNTHKALVGDLPLVLWNHGNANIAGRDLGDPAFGVGLNRFTHLTAYNAGGGALIAAIMPTHYEPVELKHALNDASGVILTKMFGDAGRVLGEADMGIPTGATHLANLSNGTHMEALLPALNYGIKSMIEAFYDYGSRKIYKGILDSVLETRLNVNIENIETSYCDLVNAPPTAAGKYIQYSIPVKDSLLVTSLALTLRKIYTTTPSSQAITATPVYMYDTIAEMKNDALVDVYRLKLPMFREYFLKLANKCRVLRAFLTKGCGSRENKRRLMRVVMPWVRWGARGGSQPVVYNINPVGMDAVAGTYGLVAGKLSLGQKVSLWALEQNTPAKLNTISAAFTTHPLTPMKGGGQAVLQDSQFYASEEFNDEDRYGYFMEIITNIEEVCISIANSCDNMAKEFVQDDKFMIPSSNYLEEHSKNHDCTVFTPLSLVSVFTSPHSAYTKLHSLTTTRGTDPFKLQYGAKGILYADSLKCINEKYIGNALNAIKKSVGSRVRIDQSNYTSFVKRYLNLFRFNFSAIDYAEQSAMAGNYASVRPLAYSGGDGDLVLGGAADEQQKVNSLVTQYELYVREHFPRGEVTTAAPGLNVRGDMNLQLRIDIDQVSKHEDMDDGYTIRQVDTNGHNPRGIWLVEFCYNFVFGDGHMGHRASTPQVNLTTLTNYYDAFNGAGPANKISRYLEVYDKYKKGNLKTIKEHANNALSLMGSDILRIANTPAVTACAVITINPANHTAIKELIEQLVGAAVGVFGALPAVGFPLVPAGGPAGPTDQATKLRLLAHLFLNLGVAIPAPVDYQTVVRRIVNFDYNQINVAMLALAGTLTAGTPLATETTDLGMALAPFGAINESMLTKYNIPNPRGDLIGNANNITASAAVPAANLVTGGIVGGALVANNIYNLIPILDVSQLIYTALSSPVSFSMLFDTIAGDDTEDIKQTLTDHLRGMLSATTKRFTGERCYEGATPLAVTGAESSTNMRSLIGLLIELNINPINVHSVQRFMPFANLYNYSYTLERFIYTLYDMEKPWEQIVYAGYGHMPGTAHQDCQNPGRQIVCFNNIFRGTDPSWIPGRIEGVPGQFASGTPRTFGEIDITSAYYEQVVKEVFIRMMIDPYAQVDTFCYGLPAGDGHKPYAYHWGPIGRIMKGFDKLGMGVPKFLSDQLYSKVLLNSMQSNTRYGPNPEVNAYCAIYATPEDDHDVTADDVHISEDARREYKRAKDAEHREEQAEADEQLGIARTVQAAKHRGTDAEIVEAAEEHYGGPFQGPKPGPGTPAAVAEETYLDTIERQEGVERADQMRAQRAAERAAVARRQELAMRGDVRPVGGADDMYKARPGRVPAVVPPVARHLVPYEPDPNIAYPEQSDWRQRMTYSSQPSLTSSGMRTRTYRAQRVGNGNQEELWRHLTFYDPDSREVLAYDLGRVFAPPGAPGGPAPAIVAGPVGPPGALGSWQHKVNDFRCEGYERFNTQLVRNVFFITNLQRTMRFCINLWLSKAYGAVSRDHRAIAAEVTERRFGDAMPMGEDNDYTNPNWI